MKTSFINKNVSKSSTVFNQMQHKKTASIVGIFSTSSLVTFFRLLTYFCCEHNVRRFARVDCHRVYTRQAKLVFVSKFWQYVYICHFKRLKIR